MSDFSVKHDPQQPSKYFTYYTVLIAWTENIHINIMYNIYIYIYMYMYIYIAIYIYSYIKNISVKM